MMLAQIVSIPGFNEPFSSLSHYLGAVVFVALGGLLIRRGRGDRLRVTALVLYVATLLFMLMMSGTFHLVRRGTPMHEIAGRLDYASIYLLIAGTFTPPHAILFRGWARWGTLALIWTIAIVGVALKMTYYQQFTHTISVAVYIAMGWIGVFGGALAWRRFGLDFVKPLFGGGLAYTIGALFEVRGTYLPLWPGVVENHEIWHVAVLVGAALHWAFIYQFADGSLPPVIDRSARVLSARSA
ncbi:MAG: DNA-binding protein [Planctomycetota bacterium]|nr:MAG: DNA-binding protein [Planctomycetota bacterium]